MAAKTASIISACGVESVITGHGGNVAAGDGHGAAFQPFIAGLDIQCAAGNRQISVCVCRIVAGGDGIAAAGDGDVPIGVDGVVGTIQRIDAAGQRQIRPRFDPFGADVVSRGNGAAAAAGDGIGPGRDHCAGLRLDTVFSGCQGQRGV